MRCHTISYRIKSPHSSSSDVLYLFSYIEDMLGTYVTEAAGNSDDTWNTMRDFVCYGDAYKVMMMA